MIRPRYRRANRRLNDINGRGRAGEVLAATSSKHDLCATLCDLQRCSLLDCRAFPDWTSFTTFLSAMALTTDHTRRNNTCAVIALPF